MTDCNISKKCFVSTNGGREVHAVVTPAVSGLFGNQLRRVWDGIESLVAENLHPVLVRWFLSDASNQAREVLALGGAYPFSIVEQPPLNGYKVSAWVWLREGETPVRDTDGIWRVRHGGYTDLIQTSACEAGLQPLTATRAMFGDLALKLADAGGSLLDNCLRTWLFVRDVDVNYAGVVAGRNESFAMNGLTPQTHFIASTGICGAHADPTVTVQMDSISSIGLKPGQVRQLSAPDHLNPTSEYGVAFERGTAVDYADRRHVFISGTASINNCGEVVYPGDVEAQTARMLENIGALLKTADCTFNDVCHMLIYLRDIADRPVVERIFAERFPDIPHIVLLAPVCRLAWLIETECMAFKAIESAYEPF